MRETVHLHPQAGLVPPWLLEPPAARDGRFLMRDLSALLLDRHLRRLARMRNPLEMRIASLLRRVQDLSGYLDLGFARLADYVTERLGISIRRMQALLQMERGLRYLPAIRAAFESGRLSGSQVLLLLRVATPEDEARWVDLALGLTVRRLERKVREALADGRAEAPEAEGRAAASEIPGDPSSDVGSRAVNAGIQSPGPALSHDRPRSAATDLEDDDGEPGMQVGFAAPRSLRARWDFAVELCRRASGGADPVWRCAEYFAAEYLAGVPDLPSLLARNLVDGGGAEIPGGDQLRGGAGPGPAGMAGGSLEESEDGSSGSGCAAGRPAEEEEGVELFEEVLRAYQEEAADGDLGAPDEGFEAVLPEPAREEAGGGARDLDARLGTLIRLRQTLAWQQGRLLRTFAAHALYRDLGFLSLGRYCTERLGLGLRRARRLIALEKHLLELPALARAYRAGEVTWVQATEIARVATELDEKDWIVLARSVTVRRLIREVAVALARQDDSLDGPADRGPRRSGPPGLEPSGRVTLRSPSWPAGPVPDGDTAQPVQTSAPIDGGPEVQTSAAIGGIPVVQTPAPVSIGAPDGWTRIGFWGPHDVARLWIHALQVCRWVEGAALDDWQCVEHLIDDFRATWEVRSDPAWQRRYRTFERDGWRCRVPGCSARNNLQQHHVVFRSQGGDDEEDNLVALCATHHVQGIHAGRLRCHRLPEGLLAWELGAGPDGSAFVRYVEDVHWEAAAGAGDRTAGTPDCAAGPGNCEVDAGNGALHAGSVRAAASK